MIYLATRMERLIDDILSHSRIGYKDIKSTECDMESIIDSVLEVLDSLLQQNNVKIKKSGTFLNVKCDKVLTEQIFQNLITNAVKYNDKSVTEIEIGCVWMQPEELPAVVIKENVTPIYKDAVVFYVRDNGIGIHEKHRGIIFRLFKRLHAKGKFGDGTGAGLAIVKKMVEKQNGRIWVDSQLKKGTTFYFTLGEETGELS